MIGFGLGVHRRVRVLINLVTQIPVLGSKNGPGTSGVDSSPRYALVTKQGSFVLCRKP